MEHELLASLVQDQLQQFQGCGGRWYVWEAGNTIEKYLRNTKIQKPFGLKPCGVIKKHLGLELKKI